MATNSRIPKFPSTCVKRPNENMYLPSRKKMCLEVPPTQVKSKLQRAVSTTSLNNVGRFSQVSKRATLQSQRSAENMRLSMAATTATKRIPMGPPVSNPKKIPAWDLKGRMEQMEKINTNLRQELKAYDDRILALEEDKTQLNADFAIKSQQSDEAVANLESLQQSLQCEKKTSEELRIKNADMEAKIKSLKLEIERNQELIPSLEKCISALTAKNNTLEVELKAIQDLLSLKTHDYTKLLEACEAKDKEILHLRENISHLELRLQEEETRRREMHNMIQELKGNIRVFCRIRPPLQEELSNRLAMSTICIKDHKVLEIASTTECPGKNRATYEFSFDHVFSSTSTQDDVFQEISQLVQSALDGYSVCIFAYGQTGSGKTYTMEGPGEINFLSSSDEPNLGMIPRSVHQIFSSAEKLKKKGWKYLFETSFMEIYNENIHDLLNKGQNNSQKCKIKKTACRGSDSYVSNVTTIEVTSEDEIYDLLKAARVNRSVAATNCNERSSRSHYIFQMKLCGENDITSEKCEGILNLVDLAGSERIKESGSSGDRLTEAKNINKSLSSLGNVIMALSQKADHIPYRNSKLTHLLMNSLGGNCKTLMFVNINPCEDSLTESVNSLRFATKVNQCNIGTAHKRIK